MPGSDLKAFERRLRDELFDNVVPFWLKHVVDEKHGGFIGRMSNELVVDERAPKGLILNARLLWTFAALYRFESDPRFLELAQRACDYLDQHFWDEQCGGVFWCVDHRGELLDDKKKIYGQAFYLYALSEFHLATGDAGALARASELFELIERHSHDDVHGGYFETCNRDWTIAQDARLSDKDMNEQKSMNNHLHVLEGYTNLCRVRRDPEIRDRLTELIDLFDRHILDHAASHFGHFFDETWRPRSDTYTFGHDIEGSWLLCEAAEVLDDAALSERVSATALRIADVVRTEGLDDDGGLFYEGRAGAVIDTNKEWWPQAEAVVGFLNAYQLSGRDDFLQAARDCWGFIERCIVDQKHGEWFWRVARDGTPDSHEPKVSEWKSPYHNTRACIETILRLRYIDKGE